MVPSSTTRRQECRTLALRQGGESSCAVAAPIDALTHCIRESTHAGIASCPARVGQPREPLSMLTDTARRILRYLAELLTAEEIAGLMLIPVSAVRAHTRSISRKLAARRLTPPLPMARTCASSEGEDAGHRITRA